MIPAMAMIYCEQLVVVLRIAAAYGRDPNDPLRAAEILVIQDRYSTVQEAAAALQRAGAASHRSDHNVRTFVEVIRLMPAMIGLHVRRFTRSPIDLLIAAAEVASFLVPVVSLPVWAIANARATRRLGHAAIDFYKGPFTVSRLETSLVLPPRPRPRTRSLMILSVVPLALALGALFYLLPIGRYRHGLQWVGLIIGELALLWTFARLIRVTRTGASDGVGAENAIGP